MIYLRVLAIALLGAQLYGCAAPAVLAGATAGGTMAAHDRRTVGAQIDDQSIEMRGSSRMAADADFSKPENAHVSVTSFNGIVLLTGETRSADMRQRAEQYVGSIPKVRKVYNELRVMAPTNIGSRSKDTWITTKVKSKLLANESVNGTRIKVVTNDGIVYLMGMVSRGEANIATSLASDTNGVKRIVRVFEYLD